MAQQAHTVIRGRICEEIDVDGHRCWTLFDSGVRNSYITSDAASSLPRLRHKAPPSPDSVSKTMFGARRIAVAIVADDALLLGVEVYRVQEVCLVCADVKGHELDFRADVLESIGNDEQGRRIDVLFGGLALKRWGMKLDLQNERLDFTRFTADFVES